jgi:hypothetical protein
MVTKKEFDFLAVVKKIQNKTPWGSTPHLIRQVPGDNPFDLL